MLQRLILGVLLLIIVGFFGQFLFVKFLVVSGFLILSIWSFREANYDALEELMGRIYLGVCGFAVITLFIIPAIMKLFHDTLSALSSGGGLLLLLIVAYIVWGDK
ncbi:hypothetical protein [Bacillus sp. Fil]|uniref:hypothetical protein n=1 Tax=Bacillus sp. Fil TaxID=3459567 RepID=UPI00403B3891